MAHPCDNCVHNERRGGIILTAADSCMAPEQFGFDEAQSGFLGTLMMDLATRLGSCPHKAVRPDFPDSYRSHDLGEPE
jgi:hypothetical protein